LPCSFRFSKKVGSKASRPIISVFIMVQFSCKMDE
jgi:hypothetical protein